jgi:hypothetical protein
MDKQFALKQLDREIDRKQEDLRAAIKHLSFALEEAVHLMDNARTPNACGIVQGMGAAIDRMVGELTALKKIREFWSAE